MYHNPSAFLDKNNSLVPSMTEVNLNELQAVSHHNGSLLYIGIF